MTHDWSRLRATLPNAVGGRSYFKLANHFRTVYLNDWNGFILSWSRFNRYTIFRNCTHTHRNDRIEYACHLDAPLDVCAFQFSSAHSPSVWFALFVRLLLLVGCTQPFLYTSLQWKLVHSAVSLCVCYLQSHLGESVLRSAERLHYVFYFTLGTPGASAPWSTKSTA